MTPPTHREMRRVIAALRDRAWHAEDSARWIGDCRIALDLRREAAAVTLAAEHLEALYPRKRKARHAP